MDLVVRASCSGSPSERSAPARLPPAESFEVEPAGMPSGWPRRPEVKLIRNNDASSFSPHHLTACVGGRPGPVSSLYTKVVAVYTAPTLDVNARSPSEALPVRFNPLIFTIRGNCRILSKNRPTL